jgi:hypothetical protein
MFVHHSWMNLTLSFAVVFSLKQDMWSPTWSNGSIIADLGYLLIQVDSDQSLIECHYSLLPCLFSVVRWMRLW